MEMDRGKATVEFFGGGQADDVDVSVVEGITRGTYVEVYGGLALSKLTPADARRRKAAWREVMKAAR